MIWIDLMRVSPNEGPMENHIARRKFIVALGSAAACPLVAHAQQPTMPVVGFLSSRSPGEFDGVVAAFRQGLGEAGFVEGQNVVIAFRWAEGRYHRLPALAAELVDQRVVVILAAGGSSSALAAKAATATVPIVFSAVSEPVQLGLVASLSPAGRQRHGHGHVRLGALGEKRRTTERVSAFSSRDGLSHESIQSERQDLRGGSGIGGKRSGTSGLRAQRQH